MVLTLGMSTLVTAEHAAKAPTPIVVTGYPSIVSGIRSSPKGSVSYPVIVTSPSEIAYVRFSYVPLVCTSRASVGSGV